jgi:DNA-dependent RNA polymerase auxiliary subunit epsilon
MHHFVCPSLISIRRPAAATRANTAARVPARERTRLLHCSIDSSRNPASAFVAGRPPRTVRRILGAPARDRYPKSAMRRHHP